VTPAAAIAELEAPVLTPECRAFLLALVKRQPEYHAQLLQELHAAAGNYRLTLLMLDCAEYNQPPPTGHEVAYQRAVALVAAGYKLPPSADALRKRLRKVVSVQAG
jgi:hypothetical protein